MSTLLAESTTAVSAAKALGVSRRTVNRYLTVGRLDDAGLGPDGERRVTLASLTRVKADLDGQRHAARDDNPPMTSAEPDPGGLVTRTLAMLEEELRARRNEVERTRETLMIAERSTATLQAERDQLKNDLDVARAEGDRVRHQLASVTHGGPLSRWKARRTAAVELAKL